MKTLKLNKEMFYQYVSACGILPTEKAVYQWFDTNKNSSNNGVGYFNVEDAYIKLSRLNLEGVSVSLAPNLFTWNGGRKKEDVIGIRCIVLDFDCGNIPKMKLPPSFIVKTKRGHHLYYVIDKKDWSKIGRLATLAQTICSYHKCDSSSSEINRAFRCAGFLHNKDIQNNCITEFGDANNKSYSIEDLESAYNNITDFNVAEKNTKEDEFEKWCLAQPIHEGVRNKTIFIISNEGVRRGIKSSFLSYSVENYADRSGYDQAQALAILKRAEAKRSKDGASNYKVTQDFLTKYYTDIKGNILLKYFGGNFYSYSNGHYRMILLDELKSNITKHIHEYDQLKTAKVRSCRDDLLASLSSYTFVKNSDINLTKGRSQNVSSLISFKNGLFDLNKYISGESEYFSDHDPKYFITNQLPFDFKVDSKCETWRTFLNDSLSGQEDIIELLQMWFGYNLVPDTSFHKFLILFGYGANGKSVITSMLSALLGENNICSLSLDAFSQTKSFLLGAMVGKLANIVGEISEVSKASEDIIKKVVAGEPITIDRKYQDPIIHYPTARLTFATNVLPRITDRSDGLSRRLLIIPFEKQILDERKQDKRLSSIDFWIDSGELSGVFLWALEGLIKLRKNGCFVIPQKVKDAISEYVNQSNPTMDFLKNNCRFDPSAKTSKRTLLKRYKHIMIENGYHPLGANNFSSEVRRLFPQVISTAELYTFHYGTGMYSRTERDRAWIGLSLVEYDQLIY